MLYLQNRTKMCNKTVQVAEILHFKNCHFVEPNHPRHVEVWLRHLGGLNQMLYLGKCSQFYRSLVEIQSIHYLSVLFLFLMLCICYIFLVFAIFLKIRFRCPDIFIHIAHLAPSFLYTVIFTYFIFHYV